MSEELGSKDQPVAVKITEMPADVDRIAVETQILEMQEARIVRAEGIESDRAQRESSVEGKRVDLARRVQRQLVFLFLLLFLAFGLLAFRSETNARNIGQQARDSTQKEYSACLLRVARTAEINPGRVAVIELLIKLVADSELTTQQKADASKTLHDGLIVPAENCGPAPS